MGKVVGVLVLALVVAATAWWWLQEEPADEGATTDVGREDVGLGSAPPVKLEGRSESAVLAAAGLGGGLEVEVRRGGAPAPSNVKIHRFAGVSPADPTRPDLSSMVDRTLRMMALRTGLIEGEPAYTAPTGTDGNLTWPSCPSGAYVIWATDASGRSGFGWVVVPKQGVHVLARIPLTDGEHTLEGRVFLREGVPYVGSLSLQRQGSRMNGGPTGRVVTNADGTFKATGLQPGALTLMALLPDGGMAASPPVQVPAQEPFHWTMEDGETTTIRGQVVAADDGAPVPGAQVSLMCGDVSAGMTMHPGPSDEAGEFAIDVPGLPAFAQASALGFGDARAGIEDPEAPLTLQLPRLHTLRGRAVEKGTTNGIGGIHVFGVSLGRGGSDWGTPTATTDPSGRFLLRGLTAGAHMVFALGRGWFSAGLPDARTEGYNPLAVTVPTEKGKDLVLEVMPAAGAKGVVLTSVGRPVVGALVKPRRQGGAGPRQSHRKEGVAVTGADGTFTHDTLLPGIPYRFEAAAPGLATIKSEPWTGEVGDDNERITIRFLPVLGVDVVVQAKADGTPIPGVKIRSGQSRAWSTTNDAGRVRVEPLPKGEVQLRIEAPAHFLARRWVKVPEAHLVPGADPFVLLLEEGSTVRGRVVLPEGVEALGLTVTAERSHDFEFDDRSAPVAKDGTFEIQGLPQGPLTLLVEGRGKGGFLSGTLRTTAPGQDALIQVTQSSSRPSPVARMEESTDASLRTLGVVLVGPDARPVARAGITLHHAGGTTGTSVQQGRATLKRVQLEDEVYLEVRKVSPTTPPAGAGLYGPFRIEGDVLNVRLERAAPTRIRVTDPAGAGVKGALVKMLPVNPKRPRVREFDFQHRASNEGHSDGEGLVNLGGLKAGSYHALIVVPPGYVQALSQTVAIGGDELTLMIERGKEVEVEILDYADKPVRGVRVVAGRRRGEGHTAERITVAQETTDEQGKVVLRGLASDVSYTLSASVTTNVRDDVMGTMVQDWDGTATTIRLERAWVTTGTVRDTGGTPVTEVTVWYREPGSSGASGIGTDADGRFRIGPQPLPALELRAGSRGGLLQPLSPGSTADGWTRVEAGRKDIELVFDPGPILVVTIQPWALTASAYAQLRPEKAEHAWPRPEHVGHEGVVRYPGLNPNETYTLWVEPDKQGRYVLEVGIRGDAGAITVTRKQGGVIRGRLRLPIGVELKNLSVSLFGGSVVSVNGRLDKDGSFEIVGVPPGRWSVHASGQTTDKTPTHYRARAADVGAGSTLDLELKPVER